MSTSLVCRVTSGAMLLSQRKPGWERKINLALLDADSNQLDVLGQLYGRYDVGLKMLGLKEEEAWVYGFNLKPGLDNLYTGYEMITRLWVAASEGRLDLIKK